MPALTVDDSEDELEVPLAITQAQAAKAQRVAVRPAMAAKTPPHSVPGGLAPPALTEAHICPLVLATVGQQFTPTQPEAAQRLVSAVRTLFSPIGSLFANDATTMEVDLADPPLVNGVTVPTSATGEKSNF